MSHYLLKAARFTCLTTFGIAALTLGGCEVSLRHPVASITRERARADLFDASGSKHGVVTLTPVQVGLLLNIAAHDLPPGRRGIHLHAVGTCSGPAFTSAGGHWNPSDRRHGAHNPEGPHKGDLPNLEVNSAGSAKLRFVMQGGRLSDGPSPLLDQDGAAIVIHAGEDDLKTDPSGNSGSRFACGVIHRG